MAASLSCPLGPGLQNNYITTTPSWKKKLNFQFSVPCKGEHSAIQSAPQSQSLPITDLPFGATHYVHQSPWAWPSPLFGQSRQRCLPTGSNANSDLFWRQGPSEHLCKESFKKKSRGLFQQIFQPSLGHRLSAAILSCVCSSACPGSRLLLQRLPQMQPPSIHKTI